MKPPTAPMMPPKGLGRGAGAGLVSEREGEVGELGLDGVGRAGDEYEREPRLPPLPARAHASPAAPASRRAVSSTIRVRDGVIGIPRPFMVRAALCPWSVAPRAPGAPGPRP